MMVSDEQIAALLEPIDPNRVKRDGKGFSHLEVWDVRCTMNRIFGFGEWSARTEVMELVVEREVEGRDGKTRWNVIYRARCTIELGGFGGATYTEWAAGDATNPTLADAHDQAIKTAESQAFKRCAVNLGDQFGLSLYRNGSTEASLDDVVGREHADSEAVPLLIQSLEQIQSPDDLTELGVTIRGLDLSTSDKEQLRRAYVTANQRLQAISDDNSAAGDSDAA